MDKSAHQTADHHWRRDPLDNGRQRTGVCRERSKSTGSAKVKQTRVFGICEQPVSCLLCAEYRTGDRTSYRRQLDVHLPPVFTGKYIEDITTSEIQAILNGIHGKKETEFKVKLVSDMILQRAVEDDIIDKNPLKSKSLRITGEAPTPTEPYSIEQMHF